MGSISEENIDLVSLHFQKRRSVLAAQQGQSASYSAQVRLYFGPLGHCNQDVQKQVHWASNEHKVLTAVCIKMRVSILNIPFNHEAQTNAFLPKHPVQEGKHTRLVSSLYQCICRIDPSLSLHSGR